MSVWSAPSPWCWAGAPKCRRREIWAALRPWANPVELESLRFACGLEPLVWRQSRAGRRRQSGMAGQFAQHSLEHGALAGSELVQERPFERLGLRDDVLVDALTPPAQAQYRAPRIAGVGAPAQPAVPAQTGEGAAHAHLVHGGETGDVAGGNAGVATQDGHHAPFRDGQIEALRIDRRKSAADAVRQYR